MHRGILVSSCRETRAHSQVIGRSGENRPGIVGARFQTVLNGPLAKRANLAGLNCGTSVVLAECYSHSARTTLPSHC